MRFKFTCLLVALVLANLAVLADNATDSSAPFIIDTRDFQGVVMLQNGAELSYSTAWGARPGASCSITADGVESTPSAGVANYPVCDGSGNGTYAWNYAVVPIATLPRAEYTLTHRIFDEDDALVDTVQRSVQLLPEPFLLGLLPLLALALTRKLGR